MRYELTDDAWAAIKPMLPNKPCGVPRVNDRRVLNGIFWILRSWAPWRDFWNGALPPIGCCIVICFGFDPFERRVLAVALASSELAGVPETWRARCVIVVPTFEAPAVVACPAIVRQPAEIERKLTVSHRCQSDPGCMRRRHTPATRWMTSDSALQPFATNGFIRLPCML